MMQPFWMVWRSSGNIQFMTYPFVMHPSRQDADDEAERLAAANPNIEFYVLKGVAKVVAVAQPFKWDRIDSIMRS